MELTVLDDGGESLLLDRGRAELNALQHTGVQDVDTGVDTVTDELDGLLDETIDAGGVVGLVDHDTVFGGLVDLGHNNGTLITVVLVELGQFLEGVVTDDIGVQHEERRVVLAQDVFRQLQWTRCTEGLSLDRKFDVDTVLLLVLLEGGDHNIGTVVHSQDNICDTSCGQALNLVQDHRPVTELDEGLGQGKGLGTNIGVSKQSKFFDCIKLFLARGTPLH